MTDAATAENRGRETITEVDWSALWDEFGFDTPDAAGTELISQTQLEAALESTRQGSVVDVRNAITAAVDDDTLAAVECQTQAGNQQLRGYHLRGGD